MKQGIAAGVIVVIFIIAAPCPGADFPPANGQQPTTLVLQCGNPATEAAAGAEQPDTPVPEPSTWLLLGAGLLGVIGAARRKRRQ